MGHCSILLSLRIHFNAFYFTCTAWHSNSIVFHTIERHFVKEEILTMGKGTIKFSLQHQIEYGVKVLFTNKLKMYFLYNRNVLIFRRDTENGKTTRNFYHRDGIGSTPNSWRLFHLQVNTCKHNVIIMARSTLHKL